ncbi:uncharacterized protein PG998_006738 [Apiospora kogelbergensis]|uniref:uncharacterized protein n=1 Tax=Apiospora kogelbergensis TaxID=1337665 RepID=UPI00312E452C
MDRDKAKSSQLRLFRSLFNHVAFPIQLPQEEDPNIPRLEAAVMDRLIISTRRMQATERDESIRAIWDSIHHTLQTATKVTNPAGRLERSRLHSQLFQFATGDGQFLILHVAAQNAAIMIRKSDEQSVVFEMFEASAKREDVLASIGALQWDFPGIAVQVPKSLLANEAFLDQICLFLEQASMESTKNFEFATKAGAAVWENRETRDPSVITSLLAAILEANGTRIAPKPLRKRVRDDVCWHNTEIPFRRLPYLLVLKVALARYLSMALGDELGRLHYKLLIATLTEYVLEECSDAVSYESQSFLVTKICRRMFKLEGDMARAPPDVQGRTHSTLRDVSARILNTTQAATRRIGLVWHKDKGDWVKRILPVPRRANPSQDLVMRMYCSREHLQQACGKLPITNTTPQQGSHKADASRKPIESMAKHHFPLFQSEKRLSHTHGIFDLFVLIKDHIEKACGLYDDNTEQKSLMLLSVMQAWMELDKAACLEYPLLRDYRPIFPSRMLEVLHLPMADDMRRARRIELYLQQRFKMSSSHMTIFDDPVKGCFAERYYDESPELHDLMFDIESEADVKRQEKSEEWAEKTETYHSLSREIDETSCVCVHDDYGNQTIHNRHCFKCYKTRERMRLRIRAFEEPLPSGEVMKKVVVFELGCPETFVAYRDTTWFIAAKLGVERLETGVDPRKQLTDYSELKDHISTSTGSLSLASTSKSFLNTHFANQRFPVDQSQIFQPNALSYAYYDSTTKCWPGRMRPKPSFAHHCRLAVPKESQYASLLSLPSFEADRGGPTSYEIVASQSSCPPGINVHEYMAFQSLMSGKARRWVTLLTELASSNLNFSTESAVLLVGHITSQLGPCGNETNDCWPHGTLHSIFSDSSFCDGLLTQLQLKLESIASNWRETNVMEIILTIALRLITLTHSLSGSSFYLVEQTRRSLVILDRIREVTILWIRKLRTETLQASDSKSAKNCQFYLLLAALLCKRACSKLLEVEQPPELVVTAFLEACIVLHDNMPEKVQELPRLVRGHLIRDLRLMYGIRDQLRDLLDSDKGKALLQSLHTTWPASETKEIIVFSIEDKERVTLILRNIHLNRESVQTVEYNLVHGSLLVEGLPLGRLSIDEKSSTILNYLFGNQSLMKFPSNEPGMSHTLCVQVNGWQTHIGYHGRETIIRITKQKVVLQYIPPEVFQHGTSFDLPSSLLDDCIHWLNVNTGKMEMRPHTSPWSHEDRNWVLDMKDWTCSRMIPATGRFNQPTKETLVDPYSDLFGRVTRIFYMFEQRRFLTVYQPEAHPLTVDLKRMNMRFYVNKALRFQSRQLRIEIDTNQDAGTWYGFDSKLVCRDTQDPAQRSILIPLGDLEVLNRGCHVQVFVKPPSTPTWLYLKYNINDTLGRLDCACEPIMVYKKAEIHAFTSCGFQPDPLTGRTGTEEALNLLASGISQPWTPLGMKPLSILQSLAKLSPRREWYPEDRRSMKREHWDARHPVSNQHEAFRPLVEAIIQKSANLAVFGSINNMDLPEPGSNDPDLAKRSLFRRQLHHRSIESLPQLEEAEDLRYKSRDTPSDTSVKHNNVYGIVDLVRARRPTMATVRNLPEALAQCASIQGYSEVSEQLTLIERLEIDVCRLWGPLVNHVRQSASEYEVMFLLATLSFRFNAPMALLRTIAAFYLYEEIQCLDYPCALEYQNLRPGQTPTVGSLLKLIESFRAPGPEDLPLMNLQPAKEKKKLFRARLAHEAKTDQECTTFAEHLLRQWPCQAPTLEGLKELTLLDVEPALKTVLPEWQRLHDNHLFVEHLEIVQSLLGVRFADIAVSRRCFVVNDDVVIRPPGRYAMPRLDKDLMKTAAFGPSVHADNIIQSVLCSAKKSNKHSWPVMERHPTINKELEQIVQRIDDPDSAISRAYANDLRGSVKALRSHRDTDATMDIQALPGMIDIRDCISQRFHAIDLMLRQPNCSINADQIQWLTAGRLWPIVTLTTLLEQLRSQAGVPFGIGMKESIVNIGLAITALQRGKRIEKYGRANQFSRIQEESRNFGHTNWSPFEYPDWLLLEIESEILIRETQVDVARAIATPKDGNSVLQMNMGQGKTSCVIPMVATMLADTKNLVRVIVPKALLQQTAQLLSTSVGGLLGRQVRHIPFSRRTSTKEDVIKLYRSLHREIQRQSGIMLCVPEHNLSFMLSGQQRLLDQRVPEANLMLRTQEWLNSTSRDIMDESDHILAVRTQLIYPSGSLCSVDGHPTRWLVIEAVLALVDMHLYNLAKTFHHSVQVVRRPEGGFPLRIYLLRSDIEEELVSRLRNDILQGIMSILPVESLAPEDRLAIREFLSGGKMRPKCTK